MSKGDARNVLVFYGSGFFPHSPQPSRPAGREGAVGHMGPGLGRREETDRRSVGPVVVMSVNAAERCRA